MCVFQLDGGLRAGVFILHVTDLFVCFHATGCLDSHLDHKLLLDLQIHLSNAVSKWRTFARTDLSYSGEFTDWLETQSILRKYC